MPTDKKRERSSIFFDEGKSLGSVSPAERNKFLSRQLVILFKKSFYLVREVRI
jgi:hypothetical protein